MSNKMDRITGIDKSDKNQKKIFIRIFLLIVGLFGAYKIVLGENNVFTMLSRFISIMSPFLFAVLLAYLLYIPSNSIEKMLKKSRVKFLEKTARGISITIVYSGLFLIVYFAMKLFIPFLIQSAKDLIYNIPNYVRTAEEYLRNNPISIFGTEVDVSTEIDKLKETNLANMVVPKISEYNLFSNLLKATSVVSALFDIFLAVIVSIYFLIYRDDISKFINKVLRSFTSRRNVRVFNSYVEKTNYIFYKFVTTQIIDSLIIGTILTIVFFVLGIQYAAPLGYMIGLLNLIPFFGAIVGVLVAAIITIFTGGFSQALILLVAAIITQQIDGNIIGPFLQGTSLKINQILIVGSIPVFGAYFGVLGMFLAVPITAVIALIVNDILNSRIQKRKKLEIKKSRTRKKPTLKLKKLKKSESFN